MQSCDTGQQILFFDSCQLITTWISNTKFYTGHIKVCHFASANMKGWMYVQMYSLLLLLRTKISWKHRLPYFLTHGAPLRTLHVLESSTIKYLPFSPFLPSIPLQLNLFNTYTGGTERSVHIREVSI